MESLEGLEFPSRSEKDLVPVRSVHVVSHVESSGSSHCLKTCTSGEPSCTTILNPTVSFLFFLNVILYSPVEPL